MTGEINIKIKDLQGEVKALAVAANTDGSDAIDSAYEHSLFTQYLQAAGIDASDYSTKYEKGGLKKSETKLVKEQKFKDGSTKEQVANMEQYEEAWQGALKTAFRAVGNDPQSRARLMEFVKTKPKLQEASSMADYAFRLGQKVAEMGNIAETDLKEFQEALTKDAVAEIKADNKENTATIVGTVVLTAEMISQQIEEGKAEVIQEIHDSEGRTAQLIKAEGNRIVKVVRNAAGQIISVVRQEGAMTRSAVHQEGAMTRYAVHQEGYFTRQQVLISEGRLHRHINASEAAIIQNDNNNRDKIIQNGNENSILSEHSEAITRNLNGDGRFIDTGHKQSTISAFNTMIQKIKGSNLPFDKKNELMQQLENLSQDGYIFDEELRVMNETIDGAISGQEPRTFGERLADRVADLNPLRENVPGNDGNTAGLGLISLLQGPGAAQIAQRLQSVDSNTLLGLLSMPGLGASVVAGGAQETVNKLTSGDPSQILEVITQGGLAGRAAEYINNYIKQ